MAAKEKLFFTASASASASPPCSRGDGDGNGGGGASQRAMASRREPLDDVEMDAARVLADFAQMALLEREGHGRAGGGWRGEEGLGRAEESEGSSRKRAMGKPAAAGAVVEKGAPELGETWTVASSSPLHQQQTRGVGDEHNKEGGECREDEELDLGSSSAVYKPACRCSNRRARQNLTEAEKEARRLRRVLANRESARQTILRRKSLCEELAKKVAELSEENEIMKTKREASMKEYLSLTDRNMQLKEQMAKIVECEVAERPSSCAKTSQQPTSEPSNSSLVHGRGGPPWADQFAWLPVDLKPSGAVSSICEEKGSVPAALPPSPNLQVPPPPCPPPWLCPIPNYLSVHPTAGHDGGEGASTGGQMRDLTSLSTGGEGCGCAEGWRSTCTLTLEFVAKQAADDTSKLCGRGAAVHDTLQVHSDLLARPLLDPVGSLRNYAVATPAPAELRPGKRMLAGTSTTAEARRRRRELRTLKHLHG